MNTNHPWQSGPSELIKHAIDHLHQEDDFNQRIAFLLLDVGVETLFKTFLQLPEEVTGTKAGFSERIKASEGNFHELIQGIRKAAGSRLDKIDLTHIQFYHDLRNKLYHQGNGITVPTEKAKGYATLVVECLKILLDVDLFPFLLIEEEIKSKQAKHRAQVDEFEKVRQELKSQFDDLHQVAILALESVEPTMVLPSFRVQYEKWLELFEAQYHAWNSKLWAESKAENTIDEVKYHPKQYASLLTEVKPNMPSVFLNFIEKHQLKEDDVLAIATSHDFEEVLLNLVVVALKLPIELRSIYFEADFIVHQKAIDTHNIMQFLGKEFEDPIVELIKTSKEVSQQIIEIRDILLTNTPRV
ncbi:MAG: hypothetical protein ABI904_14735 [Chloroflexota bacterium]